MQYISTIQQRDLRDLIRYVKKGKKGLVLSLHCFLLALIKFI